METNMKMKSYVRLSAGLALSVLFTVYASAQNDEKPSQTGAFVQELSVMHDSNEAVSTDESSEKEKEPKTVEPLIEETSIVKIGDSAPDFTVEMLEGESIKLSDKKGKIVLLNFWATWCGPCMKEFEEIPDKIIRRFGDHADFVFLPISRGETKETVRKKIDQLKKNGISFPVGLDSERKIYDLYAKNYIPRNYLIDKNGKIVDMLVGYYEKKFDEMADKIADLLNEDN
jgi:peroxiredoxin